MSTPGPKRRILIISHVFPPVGGIPVQRPLSFARYLPDCGYEVHVLTASNPGAPVLDPDLLRRVPESVKVHRCLSAEVPFSLRHGVWRLVSSSKPASAQYGPEHSPAASSRSWKPFLANIVRFLASPDPEVLWVPFAIRKAKQIIRQYNIDTVLVTAPPFSVFLTGNALKRLFPHLVLVTDFRDEWLNFYLTSSDFHSGSYLRRRAEAVERTTVELSDVVVTVTAPILSEIRARYPQQPDAKFAVLLNGYDPQAFAGFQARLHAPGKIVVVFTGTVATASSARYYLDALESLPVNIRDRFETRFVGRIADHEKHFFEGRTSAVQLLGFLPQAEALKQIEEADYLLVTMTDASSLTGKIFEYLATGKPILAVARNGGEIARLLTETHAGWQADPDEPDTVRQLLLRAAADVDRQGVDFHPRQQEIQRYQRPRLTAQLAELIELAAARRVGREKGSVHGN
jgi:glycosyltransferase involved in cell wall biosynthesis